MIGFVLNVFDIPPQPGQKAADVKTQSIMPAT